jgi:isoquinoline 1-oxidoreductase beta subunit
VAVIRVRAGIDAAGNVQAWHTRNVSPSILGQRGWVGPTTVDSQATEGLTGLPYLANARLVEWVRHPAGIPVGFWRSVGHSFNAYAVESMIDEIATAVQVDPFVYRLAQITTDTRSRSVLEAADAMSHWRKTLPAGHAWGMALAESFGSIVCQVVEISGVAGGPITVHRVAIAVDCGAPVNPDSVVAQMQGGMVHGLASILWGQVKFANGVADVKNFNRYRMLLMREMPQTTVTIVKSGTPTGGTGEPATPPIGPAVANAYAKLTGIRVRSLPMFPNAAKMSD